MSAHDSLAGSGAAGAQRLSVQLSRATLVILLAVAATVIGGLLWATHRSDEVSVQRQQRAALHAMNVALDELALQQETVALWDDAVVQMVAKPQDQTWLLDNVSAWMAHIFDHDEIWLIDDSGQPVQGVVAGKLAPSTHYWRLEPDLRPLIRATRGLIDGPNGRHDRNPGKALASDSSVETTAQATHDTHLVRVGGRPAAASTMLMQPLTPNFVGRRDAWPLVISIRYLDGGFMRDLEAKNLIERPRFTSRDDHREGEQALLVHTEWGDPLGYLIWTPELPGSRIMATLFPANLIAVALLALLMLLLLRRLTQTLHERGLLEERTTHLAFHDALTGLPNRTLLSERLDQALKADSGAVTLLLVDLDRFKQVNDTLGHLAGDQLICQLADRLTAIFRSHDTVARLGGDEFAIVLSASTARSALERCEAILALFARPFDLNGTIVHGAASIGAACSDGKGTDATELMRRADVALYRAKAEGKNCARLFRHRMDAAGKRRAQLESELREAVAEEQFAVWSQPEVDRAGKTVGHELLLRWLHPRLGTVSPDRIIPIAEETGLIMPIGDWVLQQAIAAAASGNSGFTALNLSPLQLRDEAFVERAITACQLQGVEPRAIELEITERTLLDDSRVTRSSLERLREAGFRIALDDFGTGYSSLSYLRQFVVDKIKIDRSFVADVERSPEARAIIAAIVAIGRALNLTIAAEGVENKHQEDALLVAGCDQFQGHFYARARPIVPSVEAAAA